eukprot:Gregarina_sp_Poly_1__7519@NODE_419_length_8686_cov_338_596705_g341_i0_p5_GENE_NODE_419_length_8686_cov_338_596705_g341_i0NODE_419_length_8686_cov_338_596705_g341_i0_p5_ORF_typecomplete_len281_score30_10IIGP/PF05049_13/0_0018NBARC/PF00931_22/0_15MeaB/PF03308_16/0_3_NODE_419_length_8686_cov_338_596705_g341_i07191561
MDLFLKHFSQSDQHQSSIAFVGPGGVDKSSLLDAVLGNGIQRNYRGSWVQCGSEELPGLVCHDWTVRANATSFPFKTHLSAVSGLVLIVASSLKEIDVVTARVCHEYGVPCALVHCHTPEGLCVDNSLKWKLRQAVRLNRRLRHCVEMDIFILSPLDLFEIRSLKRSHGRMDELLFLSWLLQASIVREASLRASPARECYASPKLASVDEEPQITIKFAPKEGRENPTPRTNVSRDRKVILTTSPSRPIQHGSQPVPTGFVDIDGMLLKRSRVSNVSFLS